MIISVRRTVRSFKDALLHCAFSNLFVLSTFPRCRICVVVEESKIQDRITVSHVELLMQEHE